MAEERKRQNQQTVTKTLKFLRMMAVTGRALSINEIAAYLEVTRPTAYSTVNSLVDEEYLEKNEESHKYVIGPAFYILGYYYPHLYPFLTYAESDILNLYSRLGKRVNLCVYKPPLTALLIATKDSAVLTKRNSGLTLPAYASSSGKILLSQLDDDTLFDVLTSNSLKQITPYTICDPARLFEIIVQARENGYAEDIQELVPGQVCVAAPVFSASGSMVCSISLAKIPYEQYISERELYIQEIKSSALQISMDLGFNISDTSEYNQILPVSQKNPGIQK